jgi:sugar/nucleoside kinase (ribokinase family)
MTVVVFGGCVWDVVCRGEGGVITYGHSNPGTVSEHPGGAARNFCSALSRLHPDRSFDISLISVVADDPRGKSILADLAEDGVRADHVRVVKLGGTPCYAAFVDKGEVTAVADMQLHSEVRCPAVGLGEMFGRVDAVVSDCNVEEAELLKLADRCDQEAHHQGLRLFVDTTSPAKCRKVLKLLGHRSLFLIKPNVEELAALGRHLQPLAEPMPWLVAAVQAAAVPAKLVPVLTPLLPALSALLSRGKLPLVLLTAGEHGALLVKNSGGDGAGGWVAFRRPVEGKVVSPSGCGDALLAGFVGEWVNNSAGLERKLLERCLDSGMMAASMALSSPFPFPRRTTTPIKAKM